MCSYTQLGLVTQLELQKLTFVVIQKHHLGGLQFLL
jgi:hypothetical protein